MEYSKLYKRTSTGAIQVWWQEREDARYRTHSGQVDGKIVTSEWTLAVPKNVGKSNESTGEAQAHTEVEANYELKRKKGYTDTTDEAEASTRFSPMLAKEYNKETKHVTKLLAAGPVCAQPKLDGIRCIATKDGLVSRNGNPIIAVPHIERALAPIFADFPLLRLDGELYNHDLKADFPKLVSLVRQEKPTEEDIEASKVMQFWVYDLASSDQSFAMRLGALTMLLHGHSSSVIVVETLEAATVEEIDKLFSSYVENGYEGLMIRDPKSLYEQKRSKNLIKYKPEYDGEYTILSIEEGVGNRAGKAARVFIDVPNGKSCFATVKGTLEYAARVFEERESLIGKQATILYTGITPEKALRHARVKVIHTDTRW